MGGVLPLCREAVGVFYSPSRLGNSIIRFFLSQWEFILIILFLELRELFQFNEKKNSNFLSIEFKELQ